MNWFSKGRALAKAMVMTIKNQDVFVVISKGFWQNTGHLSRFRLAPSYLLSWIRTRDPRITRPLCYTGSFLQTI